MKLEREKVHIRPVDVPSFRAEKVLAFLNTAKTAEEIARAVEFAKERDVGIKVAQNILKRRAKLGGFKNLKQVDEVPQVGPEKFTEIIIALSVREDIISRELDGSTKRPLKMSEAEIHRKFQRIAVSQNRIGGAVEMWRGNRLDVFGGFLGLYDPGYGFGVPHGDPYELSPEDEAAAKLLTGSLTAPDTAKPFVPFRTAWEVIGRPEALARVLHYQLEYETGTISGLPAVGRALGSIFKRGPIRLLAKFGSGYKELDKAVVEVDLSGCVERRIPLSSLVDDLEGSVAYQFLVGVMERVGNDVNVSVLTPALAAVQMTAFTFLMDIKMVKSDGTVIVSLGTSFNVEPQHDGQHLTGALRGTSVDVDVDPSGVFANIGAFLGCGPSQLAIQGQFQNGLRRMANGFARYVEDIALPDNFDNPRPIDTAIDLDHQEFVITFCDEPSIIQISGSIKMPT